MEKLTSIDGLVISQKKEWGEILSGYETKNKYMVLDTAGNELYMATEEGGSFILRILLRAWRPFEIQVLNFDRGLVISARRPFRFYFHELEIFDGRGELLGKIQKRFSILRRIYAVYDASGKELFELFGPIFHPWTFKIREHELEYGRITKKWSGLLKEGFTDADNFGVTFPGNWDPKLKALFLGAVFLIDFVHFENKGDN